MAPFHQATCIDLAVSKSESIDKLKIYTARVDPQWVVGVVPHGGYILALLVEAGMKNQANTNHRDPIHITAHYMKSASIAPYEIHIRTLKNGRTFTDLTADFVQEGNSRIKAHLIFGTNVDTSAQSPHLNLQPSSPYARRIPLHSHPSTVPTTKVAHPKRWAFTPYFRMYSDPETLAKNNPGDPSRSDSARVGGGGLEWGAWFQFTDKDDIITSPSVAFLADIFSNLPSLMPHSESKGFGRNWFPTMFIQVEFKAPIPKRSEYHSDHTVGLYSTSKFLNDGRHDACVEIWTAPSDIGEGEDKNDWRDKQVCLAVSTQLAYTFPFEVNLAKAAKL